MFSNSLDYLGRSISVAEIAQCHPFLAMRRIRKSSLREHASTNFASNLLWLLPPSPLALMMAVSTYLPTDPA